MQDKMHNSSVILTIPEQNAQSNDIPKGGTKLSQTKSDKELKKLQKQWQEKNREQVNSAEMTHRILNGRYKPEQEEQENQKPTGKFFGVPKISPHCETPQLDVKTEKPLEEWRDLYDSGEDHREL